MNIALIDPSLVTRYGLKCLMLETVENPEFIEHSSLTEFLSAESSPPIDLMLITINKLCSLTRDQLSKMVNTGCVILSMISNDVTPYSEFLVSCGVKSILFQNADPKELTYAIDLILTGKSHYNSAIIKQLVTSNFAVGNGYRSEVKLSDREIQVVNLISYGYSTKMIGTELGLSHRTVDAHKRSILKKTGMPNSVALVRFAFRHNLISLDA